MLSNLISNGLREQMVGMFNKFSAPNTYCLDNFTPVNVDA